MHTLPELVLSQSLQCLVRRTEQTLHQHHLQKVNHESKQQAEDDRIREDSLFFVETHVFYM